MPVESAEYISQLVPANPPATDPVAQGSQHLSLIKNVLQSTFPNLNAAVTATPAVLNNLTALFGTAGSALQGNFGTVLLTSTSLSGQVALTGSGSGFAINTTSGTTVTKEVSSDGHGNITVAESIAAASIGVTASVTTSPTGYVNAGSIQKFGNELLPTGVICMWSGAATAIPAGWLLCNGSSGTPDLRGMFVIGAGGAYGVGASGGSSTNTLSVANMPSHTHTVNDYGHTHTINDSGHSHGITDPGHSHGTTDPTHNHGIPGTMIAGNGGSSGGSVNAGSSYNTTNGSTTSNASTGISIQTGHTGVSVQTAGTGVSNQSAATGISLATAGSGTAVNNMPPYYALCFIMKT